MKNYSVYDRQKLYSEEEYVPDLVEKGLAMAYSREGQFEATNWDHHFLSLRRTFAVDILIRRFTPTASGKIPFTKHILRNMVWT
eukprot:UN09672